MGSMKGSVVRHGKVCSLDVSCGRSNDDLEERQRDQRYAFQLELFDQEEAQLERESQRWLYQTMEGDTFPWLPSLMDQLASVPDGVDTIGDDAIDESLKLYRSAVINSRFSKRSGHGAAFGGMHAADAGGRTFVRAGHADSATTASDGDTCVTSRGTLRTGGCSSSRGDDACALSGSQGSSGGTRGASVGVVHGADTVGGSCVCTGRASAFGAALASDGGGLCLSSAVLDTGYGGASHGDDAIGAGVLMGSLCSSESASASDGGGVCPSSEELDTGCGGASRGDDAVVRDPSCGGASHGDDAIGTSALAESLGSSESARGAAVGECRSVVAVGGSLARARSAIGAALARARSAIDAASASDGGSLCRSSAVLSAGCGCASHGDDALGSGALLGSLGASESAREAVFGEC